MGCVRPSQKLKSPTTLTRCALGAHTAKCTPRTPAIFAHMCAQFFVVLVVRAFAEKIKVVVGEQWRERVRVVSLENISVAEANLQAVSRRRHGFASASCRRCSRESALRTRRRDVFASRGALLPSCPQHRHFRRVRTKNANRQRLLSVLLRPVWPQNRKWIGMLPAHDQRDVFLQGVQRLLGIRCGSFEFVFFSHNGCKSNAGVRATILPDGRRHAKRSAL